MFTEESILKARRLVHAMWSLVETDDDRNHVENAMCYLGMAQVYARVESLDLVRDNWRRAMTRLKLIKTPVVTLDLSMEG